jgi:hypothetical protein
LLLIPFSFGGRRARNGIAPRKPVRANWFVTLPAGRNCWRHGQQSVTLVGMTSRDRLALLHGPYRSPALRKGDRADCLYRDCEVVITSWTDAPIPWPRCRSVDYKRSRPALLVDDELVRAIQHESATAVGFWWRVSVSVVWGWRRSFLVTKVNNNGSNRLVRAAAEKGAAAMQAREFTKPDREVKRRLAIDNDLQRHLRAVVREETWTEDEIALLGQLSEAVVAKKIGRTAEAVRLKRVKLGLSNPTTTHWNAEEIALLGTMPDEDVAKRLGQSVASVTQKRCKLGIPTMFDGRKMNGKW